MDELVATPIELEVQLNDTFKRYHVGVAASLLDHASTSVVSKQCPINWADCIHPRNACALNVFRHFAIFTLLMLQNTVFYTPEIFFVSLSVRLYVCVCRIHAPCHTG